MKLPNFRDLLDRLRGRRHKETQDPFAPVTAGGVEVLPSDQPPVAESVSKVFGITLSCERKIIAFESGDQPAHERALTGSYYVLTMRATGENPDYPADLTPIRKVFAEFMTNDRSLDDKEHANGGSEWSAKSRYTHFEVFEDFTEGTVDADGMNVPAHHRIGLKGISRSALDRTLEIEGIKIQCISNTGYSSSTLFPDGWVRVRDQETPEYRAYAANKGDTRFKLD